MSQLPELPLINGKPQLWLTAKEARQYGEQCRREALEEARKVCNSERLEDATDSVQDRAYQMAITHCADAIRALIDKEAT